MKNILIKIFLLLVIIVNLSSCKKTLSDQYLNPELSTQGNMSQLFTGMLLNNRIHSSYQDYFTFIMSVTGLATQMNGIAPSPQMYVPNQTYTDNRWSDFYDGSIGSGTLPGNIDYRYSGPGIMSNYAEMQKTYAALSSADQQNNYIFLQVGKVIMYDQAAQMVDLWGNIPFFKANSLNQSGSISYAPFDDAATIYDTIINGLEQLNTYFSTVSLTQTAQGLLTAQDMIYKGSISNWRRYTNSLRLRLLMRISDVSASVAQSAITAMLNNPDQYPLIDDNSYNALLKQSPTKLVSDLSGVLGYSSFRFAPAYMLDTVMQANGDPRLPVFWSPASSGNYIGFPANGTAAMYNNGISKQTYSTFDSASFIYNYNVPGVLFTAAETDFIKAEAMEKWNLGDASAPYYAGITQSINFYYSINQSRVLNTSLTWPVLGTPTSTDISTFEAMPAIVYSGTTNQRLEKIGIQKWVNFFIMQAGQAWADYRRTGYPRLYFQPANYPAAPLPPNRILYPVAEKTYNTSNYSKVQAQDTRSTKIFWDIN